MHWKYTKRQAIRGQMVQAYQGRVCMSRKGLRPFRERIFLFTRRPKVHAGSMVQLAISEGFWGICPSCGRGGEWLDYGNDDCHFLGCRRHGFCWSAERSSVLIQSRVRADLELWDRNISLLSRLQYIPLFYPITRLLWKKGGARLFRRSRKSRTLFGLN
jgi:hypothetical protein